MAKKAFDRETYNVPSYILINNKVDTKKVIF